MQERSRIPGDPAEGRPETRLKGWAPPAAPELGISARQDADDPERTADQSPVAFETGELVMKNPAAVALGRLGGKKGGKARASRMTASERSDAARRAAIARWGAKDDK